MAVTLSTTYQSPEFNFATYLDDTTPEVEANNALANIVSIAAQRAEYLGYLDNIQWVDDKEYYVAPNGGMLLRAQIEGYIEANEHAIAQWALTLADAVRRSDTTEEA